MEKPILTISGKDFQSGISPMGAHAERGGLFYKAAGVTPLFDAGGSLSANNGLLMAGTAAAAGSYGSVTGNIISSMVYSGAAIANCFALFVTSASKICRLDSSAGLPSGSLTTIFTAGHTMTPGMGVLTSGGLTYILYRQIDQLGRYETGAAAQTDAYLAMTTDYFGAMHFHYGLNKYIMGNGPGKLATLDTAFNSNLAALSFDLDSYASAISDDGTYVVAAITRNKAADPTILSDTRIIFWDGSVTTGFIRNYSITDPFISRLEKTPAGLFAFGVTGIWQVTFDGVKKIFNHSPGIYTGTVGATNIHYGQASSFFSDALIWGGQVGSSTARAVKSLGKLDSSALAAYLQPYLGTVSKNITNVNGQLLKGAILVADDTPQFSYYTVGSGTPNTGVSAQTVYFSLPQPYDITHIDVLFGEPLASGDTLDLDVFKDEDTAAVDFGAVSYDANKTIKRFQFRNANGGHIEVTEQFGLLPTFTAGAVKIKKIKVYGIPRSEINV